MMRMLLRARALRREPTMAVCRNAVPVHQGMSEAFSTGSQAQ